MSIIRIWRGHVCRCSRDQRAAGALACCPAMLQPPPRTIPLVQIPRSTLGFDMNDRLIYCRRRSRPGLCCRAKSDSGLKQRQPRSKLHQLLYKRRSHLSSSQSYRSKDIPESEEECSRYLVPQVRRRVNSYTSSRKDLPRKRKD